MIVRVPDLTEEVRKVVFCEPAASLNDRIDASPGREDEHFVGDLEVDGELYRTEGDVHFSGSVGAQVRSVCSRCLEEFVWQLERDFSFVIVPAKAAEEPQDDEGIDHYSGDDLDLAPLVCEQALLALDLSLLCSDSCRGLCAGCGANLNVEECRCANR